MKLLIFVLAIFSFEALANNAIIPNHYRGRRVINTMAALGWGDRHEAGATLNHRSQKVKDGGADYSESKQTYATTQLFHRLDPKINFEGVLGYFISETDILSTTTPNSESTSKTAILGVGFLPAENFAISAQYFHFRADNKSSAGVKSHSRGETVILGGGYKLPDNMYLGGGISGGWTNDLLGDEPDYTYLLGAGKVFGDDSNPIAAGEGTLSYANEDSSQEYDFNLRFLINQGPIQYYGGSTIGFEEGADKESTTSFNGGLDYQLGSYYLNPFFSYRVTEDDSGLKNTDTDLDLSVESGYRVKPLEIFARLDYESGKTDYDSGSDLENKAFVVTLGANYIF